MAEELLVVGLSHHTASLEVRERLAFSGDELPAAVNGLVALPQLGEAMVLSTCNRVEVYGVTRPRRAVPTADAAHAVRSFLAYVKGIPIEQLEPHLLERFGSPAARHVFRVAASLESAVLGEAQILSQLKCAYAAARAAGGIGPVLSRCVERAFGVAKRVRSETAIACGSASVSSVAADLAQRIFADLTGRMVLLIGAGKMAGLAARHLARDHGAEVVVVNRSAGHAAELALRVGGHARPYAELEALLADSDIVISSTGSPRPLIDRGLMRRVMKARKNRPVFLVDIAVPRDIEAGVGDLDGVYLYDLDDLSRLAALAVEGRRGEVESAERLVEEEVARFVDWVRGQEVAPTIVELRERFLDVARTEAERTVATLSCRSQPLGEAQEKLVRRLAEAIVGKLLHSPVMALKEQPGAESAVLVAATRRLFALAGASPDGQASARGARRLNGRQLSPTPPATSDDGGAGSHSAAMERPVASGVPDTRSDVESPTC